MISSLQAELFVTPRFKVRAIGDEVNSKWWFSAIDIVRAINKEDDYVKAGNYWRWLKKKLNADGVELVSVTHEFKFEAPDGKKRSAGYSA